jgi:hypothetical protein
MLKEPDSLVGLSAITSLSAITALVEASPQQLDLG